MRRFDSHSGLPEDLVRSVVEDRDGNIWAGTNGGIARLEGDRFAVPATGAEGNVVRTLFEDREGDLWVGGNNGLTRLRDDAFTAYGKTEGLPSDEPNAVFQDHMGRVWVGFQDAGLMLFSGGGRRLFTLATGCRKRRFFPSARGPGGDLLMGTRAGLVRMHGATFTIYGYRPTRRGAAWFSTPWRIPRDGFGWRLRAAWWRDRGENARNVAGGGPLIVNGVATLCQGRRRRAVGRKLR